MKARPTVTFDSLAFDETESVRSLADREGMGPLEKIENIIVAHAHDGSIAGFVRLTTVENIVYANPIIINPKMRRQGIGQALMEQAAIRSGGSVDLVARGSALPFCRALGAVDLPWEAMASRFCEECSRCPGMAFCHPQPMRYQIDQAV